MKIIIKPFEPFTDKFGRHLRFMFCGITRVRLQDDQGRNYIMTYDKVTRIM